MVKKVRHQDVSPNKDQESKEKKVEKVQPAGAKREKVVLIEEAENGSDCSRSKSRRAKD